MISNYVLIFGSTTNISNAPNKEQLWIDFKLCSYFWFDNDKINLNSCVVVVNWFQIMFLFLVRQPQYFRGRRYYSCELISNYVLIFGSTTFGVGVVIHFMLWIDFKLCSYFWFDNEKPVFATASTVVNWFQIMFLFLVRQLLRQRTHPKCSCELISNYVLIFGSTTNGLGINYGN